MTVRSSRLVFSVISFGWALFVAPTLKAAIVYSDDFSGGTVGTPVNLNGTTPDSTIGGATWTSRTTATAVTTNGTSANGTSSSTSSLPLTVTGGNIYTLSANISYNTTATSSVFGGIGFFNAAGVTATDGSYSSVETTPWMFVRSGAASGASAETTVGDISNRIGASGGIVNTNLNLTVTSSILLTVILDTTGAQWTLRTQANGVDLDLNGATAGTIYTYSPTQTTTLASSITAVGLTNSNATSLTASWSNFQLDVVPEPSSALLLLGSLGLLIHRRRR